MIGIIGAMKEEIELFEKNIQINQEKKIANLKFIQGTLCEKKIVLVKSGVGKVNATMCTQILIDKFSCTKIIMCGVAGSLSKELKTGDIIAGKKYIQHDLNAVPLGFKVGQIPYTNDQFFEADKNLVKKAIDEGKKLNLKIISGTIATGDIFLENKNHASKIKKDFNADAIDMEACAVAQTCTYNSIPFIVIKAISDNAGNNSSINFQEFLGKAAENSFKLTQEIIKTS